MRGLDIPWYEAYPCFLKYRRTICTILRRNGYPCYPKPSDRFLTYVRDAIEMDGSGDVTWFLNRILSRCYSYADEEDKEIKPSQVKITQSQLTKDVKPTEQKIGDSQKRESTQQTKSQNIFSNKILFALLVIVIVGVLIYYFGRK